MITPFETLQPAARTDAGLVEGTSLLLTGPWARHNCWHNCWLINPHSGIAPPSSDPPLFRGPTPAPAPALTPCPLIVIQTWTPKTLAQGTRYDTPHVLIALGSTSHCARVSVVPLAMPHVTETYPRRIHLSLQHRVLLRGPLTNSALG